MTIIEIIANAYKEDMPNGDITTEILINPEKISNATLVAKEEGVIAGIDVFAECFKYIDPTIEIKYLIEDGDCVNKGCTIAQITGPTSSILKAERVALNILQRMSGIATLARRFSIALKDYNTFVYDTRKTTPNFRAVERLAVRIGGCKNHRLNLSDMVMIKDNHIQAVGSIFKAIQLARSNVDKKIAVEVESLEQFDEAVKAAPDIIMLDNMSLRNMKLCVEKLTNDKIELEATGNVTIDNVVEIAKTGVTRISTGQLTHSYKSLDISLRFNND